MSFADSIQMIVFSVLTSTIGSQGGPKKMAAANFLCLYLPKNRSSIHFFFNFISVAAPSGLLLKKIILDDLCSNKETKVSRNPLPSTCTGDLGPISRKSLNFSGAFRVT